MQKHDGLVIDFVLNTAIGGKLGVEPGDVLVSINGMPVKDVIDYKYLATEENVDVRIRKASGEELVFDIEKEFDADLGFGFLSPTGDKIKTCHNRCLFCFVDQMPSGLRESLYCKDDDYRLSFLHGSFLTLTNLTENDIERIVNLHFSPLYVSVHTTNPDLRVQMLRNRHAGNALETLKRFAEAGIEMHAQIVLCPGINDSEELERTLQDLYNLKENIASVAAVPVGLTGHREGLYELKSFNAETAAKVITQIEAWQAKMRKDEGITWVYAADEFYLLSGREIPGRKYYDDFPQTENGVGLVRLFLDEVYRALRKAPEILPERRKVTIATGVSGEKVLRKFLDNLDNIANLDIDLRVIKNNFFGGNVTVAGLLTATDILSQIDKRSLGDILIIPAVVLRKGEDVFLDGYTLEQFTAEVGTKVEVADGGKDFIEKVTGIKSKRPRIKC